MVEGIIEASLEMAGTANVWPPRRAFSNIPKLTQGPSEVLHVLDESALVLIAELTPEGVPRSSMKSGHIFTSRSFFIILL